MDDPTQEAKNKKAYKNQINRQNSFGSRKL